MRTQFLLLGPGILLASFLAATLVMAAAPSYKPESMHRVVIDVTADGIEPWTGVLNNIENLRRAFGRDNSEIHVIGRGKGIGMMLAKNALADRMKTLLEIANILALAEHKGRVVRAKSDAFCAKLERFDFGVDVSESTRALVDILPLCRQHKLTSYDATYLELALRRNLPLATFEIDLRKVAKSLGVTLVGI